MFRNNRCFGGGMNMNGCGMPGMEYQPVYEYPQERIVHREIHHHVNHVQPINTKVCNHHIIHHSCQPCFTSCEENDCCNVYDGGYRY